VTRILTSNEVKGMVLDMEIGTLLTVHNDGVKTFVRRIEEDKYGVAPYDVQVGKFVKKADLGLVLSGMLSIID